MEYMEDGWSVVTYKRRRRDVGEKRVKTCVSKSEGSEIKEEDECKFPEPIHYKCKKYEY
jgi:hypothetical protein